MTDRPTDRQRGWSVSINVASFKFNQPHLRSVPSATYAGDETHRADKRIVDSRCRRRFIPSYTFIPPSPKSDRCRVWIYVRPSLFLNRNNSGRKGGEREKKKSCLIARWSSPPCDHPLQRISSIFTSDLILPYINHTLYQ